MVGVAADGGAPACKLAPACTRTMTSARKNSLTPRFARRCRCLRRCGAAPRVTPQAPRVHISPLMTSRHLVRRTASPQQPPSQLGTEHAACCVTPLTSNAVPPVHRRHALTFGQASHPTGPTVSSTGYKLAVLHWYARPGELQPVHPNPPAWREPWAAAALRLLTLTHLCSLCSVERRRSESSQWAAEQAGAVQSPKAADSGSGRRRR